MPKLLASAFVLLIVLAAGAALAQDEAAASAISHGPLSGEVGPDSVVLWARADGQGIITFEVSTTEDFAEVLALAEVDAIAENDFTAEAPIENLSPATAYYYRVSLGGGEAKTGTFRTAPASDEAAAVNFLFGACLGGQGYCRPPETGWQIFNTMAAQNPDFFLFIGDTIYSGSACPTDQNQNVPGAEAPVSDLAGYYGRYRYHLEDPHYAAFLAQVPVYTSWDDHEIMDNFSGVEMRRLNPARYAEGRKAYFDYWPLLGDGATDGQIYRQVSYGAHADLFILDNRSFRDPNVNWDPSPVNGQPKTMLGAEQYAWLTESLSRSTATWKFIVSSVPLSYPTGFPQPQVDGRDGWANGPDKSGFETELMRLMFYIESQDISNVIFLTGDTHWPYAISYDPDGNGEPNFYEFSSSPISAIPLAPGTPDLTFNPTVIYAEGEFRGTLFNFGQISIAEDGSLSFRIWQGDGTEKFSLTLDPQ
jgi:alkaline phosphatase D